MPAAAGFWGRGKDMIMIGMDFVSFLILLVIAVIVAAILHYGLQLYVVPGTRSFLAKIVLGWIGAWLGSPVLGHWWEPLKYCEIYIVPAILGAFALLIVAVDGVKSIGKACAGTSAGAEDAAS